LLLMQLSECILDDLFLTFQFFFFYYSLFTLALRQCPKGWTCVIPLLKVFYKSNTYIKDWSSPMMSLRLYKTNRSRASNNKVLKEFKFFSPRGCPNTCLSL
jgi:hypothetical protein